MDAKELAVLAELSGMGMETVDPNVDLSVSHINIAQALTPQKDKEDPVYIEGLEEGEFYDVALGERLGREIRFIPVAYRKRWLVVGTREDGTEGLIQVCDDDSIIDECQPGAREKPKLRFLDNGNKVVETAYFFGWLVEEGGVRRECYITMSSTQLRKAKSWIGLARSEMIDDGSGGLIMAPLCWRIYTLTTRRESNDQGKWYGWHVARSDDTLASIAGNNLADILKDAHDVNNNIDAHPLLTPRETPKMIEGETVEEPM